MTTQKTNTTNHMITLKEAVELTGKSEVTIRRLVKKGKVTSRKDKSKTGFVYFIDKDTLLSYYNDDYLQSNITISQPNQTTIQESDHVISHTSSHNTKNIENKESDATSQATTHTNSQSIVNFLKDELNRLRDDIKYERQKGETLTKDKDEKITKLQEEMGQLRGQIGFWEGQAKAYEKQIKILQLQAPLANREQPKNEEKTDNIETKTGEQTTTPDIITVQATKIMPEVINNKTEEGEKKESDIIHQTKHFSIAFWIVIILVFSGFATLVYAYLNGLLK